MRNRGFGVELEFDSNGLGYAGVGKLLWDNGFDEWTGPRYKEDCYCECGDDNTNCQGYWEYEYISEDGSEVEVRSPILRGVKGFNELKKVVDLLNSKGCFVTERDGLHVHHDSPEFAGNKELIVKLLRSWKYNESHIAKFIDEHRANEALTNRYHSPCPSFSEEAIDRFENETNRYHTLGRTNLNITPLEYNGSIEFRFHEGTLNYEEIEAWIRFGQSFLNAVVAANEPIPEAESPIVLMNRLRTSKKAKAFLAHKSVAGVAYA